MAGGAKGKTSKLLGGGLLLLLVIGLAGFGATNFGGSVTAIGRVGDTEVSARRYSRELQAEMRAFSAQTGQNLTMAQAQQFGLPQQVIQRLFDQAAAENEAREAGISAGDAAVRDQIVTIPGFQGVDGQFDPEAYRFALESAGLTAREFEEQLRGEIARTLVQSAVASGIAVPAAYPDTLVGYLGERRDLAWIALTPDTLEQEIDEPTEDELRAYYDANPDDFTLPPAKLITYAWLSPEMVMERTEVDEAALRDMYEARESEYSVPEKRLVERLVFATMEEAEAARAALDAGETDFETLVEERGLDLSDTDMGDVARSDLGSNAAEAVFALEEPGIAGPVSTDLGPAIFRMNAILEAQETPFEDVRDQLEADYLSDAARRDIAARIDEIDDRLAGGATLEDLAQETGMELGTVRWTPEANEGIAGFEEFVEAAAAAEEGDYPEVLQLSDGGIFALRLDAEEGATLQEFETVEDQVREAWREAQLAEALRERAEALQAQLAEGRRIDALAGSAEAALAEAATSEDASSEEGEDAPAARAATPALEVTRAGDIRRDGGIEGVPGTLIPQAFALAEGESAVVEGQVDGAPMAALLVVEAIKAPDPADPDISQAKADVAAQAQQGIAADLLSAYTQALRQEYGVEVRQSAVNAVHAAFP